MSRETASSGQSSHSQTSASAPTDVQNTTETATTVAEDSNNNTSLIDREQPTEGAVADGNNSPSIREIHKNSWLKRMPCVDRWSGRFPKVHKFPLLFCF